MAGRSDATLRACGKGARRDEPPQSVRPRRARPRGRGRAGRARLGVAGPRRTRPGSARRLRQPRPLHPGQVPAAAGGGAGRLGALGPLAGRGRGRRRHARRRGRAGGRPAPPAAAGRPDRRGRGRLAAALPPLGRRAGLARWRPRRARHRPHAAAAAPRRLRLLPRPGGPRRRGRRRPPADRPRRGVAGRLQALRRPHHPDPGRARLARRGAAGRPAAGAAAAGGRDRSRPGRAGPPAAVRPRRAGVLRRHHRRRRAHPARRAAAPGAPRRRAAAQPGRCGRAGRPRAHRAAPGRLRCGPVEPSATVALAGDTMLGRGVARALAAGPPAALLAPEGVAAAREADLVVLNLECCVSARGSRFPMPGKPFFFRAPPVAVELLRLLGVGCVTVANNHALDYGPEALADTLELLAAAGIATVGAGAGPEQARRPAVLAAGGLRVAVVGVTDHPPEFAAAPGRPGVAFADLYREVPGWLPRTVRQAGAGADAVLVAPHWGPNLTAAPVPHGVRGRILYDLGDFLDDYAVDARLRNDLGLLFLMTLDRRGPVRLQALPLKLDFCRTGLAAGEDAAWMRRRFRDACAALGTQVREADGRLLVDWR